jgi:hypothetical protein
VILSIDEIVDTITRFLKGTVHNILRFFQIIDAVGISPMVSCKDQWFGGSRLQLSKITSSGSVTGSQTTDRSSSS